MTIRLGYLADSGRYSSHPDQTSVMAFSSKSLAGPGYVILNIMRIMNIIALIMVIVASWVMLVKTFVVSKVRFRFLNMMARHD